MNKMMMQARQPRRQEQGVVLVVSLVLLIAMTILGVATLSGTRLNEKRTSNAQQKAIAFEVAESAIASVWNADYLNAALTSGTNDGSNDPIAITSPDIDTGLTTDFNQLKDGKGVSIEGELSVQYCGETDPVASDLSADLSATQLVFLLVDVNSEAQVVNTHTLADHVQRGAVTSVKTNRTGNCPAP